LKISLHATKISRLALLLFIPALFFISTSYSQINQSKLDSLSRSINSSAKAYRAWQDSFKKAQDSVYRSALKKDLQKSRSGRENFSAEERRRKERERQQTTLRIILSIAILITAVFVWRRRRKTKT
jgi:hypothetical protein